MTRIEYEMTKDVWDKKGKKFLEISMNKIKKIDECKV